METNYAVLFNDRELAVVSSMLRTATLSLKIIDAVSSDIASYD